MDNVRRQPSIEKSIKYLKKEDFRVALSGMIIDKKENAFLLDDGTGQITVYCEEPINLNNYIRVFGKVIPLENDFELQAELIQDISGMDKELHKKVKELIK